MPDKRAHRGPDPRDAEAFGPLNLPALRGRRRSFLASRPELLAGCRSETGW